VAKDRNHHSLACFVDVQKAFDSVSPVILTSKLMKYGFDQNACDLLSSFMSTRSQFVDIGGSYSTHRLVSCGVPQGSLLGPTLFTVFFNDICSLPFKSRVYLYADDTTLHISGSTLQSIAEALNDDLSLLHNWMDSNCLRINASKSEVMHIRPSRCAQSLGSGAININNVPIRCSPSIRFLGVSLDDNLSGEAYFDHLRRSLVGAVAAISRASRHLNEKTLLLIYHAFFSSRLSYGVEVFGLTYNNMIDPIFKLQKRALRMVAGKSPREHTAPIFVRLDVLPYPIFIRYSICLFIYKILSGILPNVLSLRVSTGVTRGSNERLILLERCRSNTAQFSICVKGAALWNALPRDIRNGCYTVSTFKRTLKKSLFVHMLDHN
jgi:hypothetical protein